MSSAPTAEQMDFFLTFLEKYTPLARGYLRSAQNRIKGRKLWEELTRKLNALGGAHKSTKQWQKVWADKKYLVKKAVSTSKESTDGGPSSASVFTDTELRIASIIGKSSWENNTSLTVLHLPTLPIVTDKHCVKTGEDCSRTEEDCLKTEEYCLRTEEECLRTEEDCLRTEEDCSRTEEDCSRTEEDYLETDADSLETDEASVADSPVPGPQRRQRVTHRQASQESGFRSRLFRMEKERLATQKLQAQELGAIRRSLDTLVNLMQTYMHRE